MDHRIVFAEMVDMHLEVRPFIVDSVCKTSLEALVTVVGIVVHVDLSKSMDFFG